MIGRILTIYFLLFSVQQANDKTEVMFEAGPTYVGTTKYKLPQFYLDRFEVTNSQYADFVSKADVNEPLSLRLDGYSGPNQPAAGMDWYDASLYCRFHGKRLPRMIEFIRASQGQTPQLYPFGNKFPSFQKAPFITHSQRPLTTSSVNSFHQFRTNEGIYQLAGNVSEWTQDYADQPLDIIEKPELRKKFKGEGKFKVYGGSFKSSVNAIKVGSYLAVDPTENFNLDIGFRCARDKNTMIADSSGFMNINPDEIKALVYGNDKQKQKILDISAKRNVKEIQERQKKVDKEDRKKKLKLESFRILKERELLVSEEKEGQTSASIFIPYGMFIMGDSQFPVSSPERMVYLDAFEIDRKLVTVKQFQEFSNKNKIRIPYKLGISVTNTKSELAYVTWNHARAYCKQQKMDLPSEAQWEKSVKGLSEDSDVTLGPKENPIGYFGIKQVVRGYDEWTLDSFAPYEMVEKNQGYRNPILELSSSSFKVYRGHGNLPQDDPKISNNLSIGSRYISHQRALHAFRCVRNLGEAGKPNFEINRKKNYLTPEFYNETRKLINAGENPLAIKIDMGEFEKKN